FHATLNQLSLVTLKNNNKTPTNATDDKSYLWLDLSQLSAELSFPTRRSSDLYDVGLKVNQAKDTDTNPNNNPPKLDWTTFFGNRAEEKTAEVRFRGVGAGGVIEEKGSLILNAFGVVMVKGSFKLQLGTVIEKG